MDTEHSENERMHRLLGGALDEVEFDADVVPAVLTGYDHTVRVRRYGAAGTAVAMLAVAAGAAVLLPHHGSGAAGPGSGKQSAAVTNPKPDLRKAALADPAGCGHQRWALSYRGGGNAPGGTLSPDPDAERANCAALTAAVTTVLPDATLTPAYFGVLEFDPRVNQDAVKKAQDKASTPDLMRTAGEEQKYLSVHPEDQANVFYPNGYTIATPAGREGFNIRYGLNEMQSLAGYAADCKDAHAEPAHCEPLVTANGWHGALFSGKPKDMVMSNTGMQTAVLADDHGHTAVVSWDGSSMEDWYQIDAYAPDGGVNEPNHGKWTNRWTGEVVTTFDPPKRPALTGAQWSKLLSSADFRGYLDGFVKYNAKLPIDPLDLQPHGPLATAPSPAR